MLVQPVDDIFGYGRKQIVCQIKPKLDYYITRRMLLAMMLTRQANAGRHISGVMALTRKPTTP